MCPYAPWVHSTGVRLTRRVAAPTARLLLDELADAGMFTSLLDTAADGREGSTHVWTPAHLTEVLDDEDGRWTWDVFTVTGSLRTWGGGAVSAWGSGFATTVTDRTALLAARLTRAQPGRDDKIVVSWR
ncbi:hypothetical protein [Mycobacterium leprae]|nr:hypothetical protein [Mycobacterium leprae]